MSKPATQKFVIIRASQLDMRMRSDRTFVSPGVPLYGNEEVISAENFTLIHEDAHGASAMATVFTQQIIEQELDEDDNDGE